MGNCCAGRQVHIRNSSDGFKHDVTYSDLHTSHYGLKKTSVADQKQLLKEEGQSIRAYSTAEDVISVESNNMCDPPSSEEGGNVTNLGNSQIPPPPGNGIPPLGTGIPPPPGILPPPPSLALPSFGSTNAASNIRAGPKIRRIHYESIQGKVTKGTVFARQESVRMDENFEKWVLDSFTIEEKSKKRHSSVVEKKSINKKVLSVKRRQNVSIPLKSMGISASEILNALTEMETGILTEENLERIQAIYPTDKELKEIKMTMKLLTRRKYPRTKNAVEVDKLVVELLPMEEKLMVKLSRVPNCKQRIKLMLFLYSYKSEYERVLRILNIIRKAQTKVADAAQHGHLRQILYNVLRFINMLNRTKEIGFRISTLSKLAGTKMTKGQGSLMDVIVMHSTTFKKEENGDFEEELSELEDVCDIEFNEIKCMVREMEKSYQEIKDVLTNSVESKENKSYLDHLRKFVKIENERFASLQRSINECWEDFVKLRTYFFEPEMKMNTFFKVFVNFREDYKKCKREMIEKKARAEKRKKDAEMKKQLRARRRSVSRSRTRMPPSFRTTRTRSKSVTSFTHDTSVVKTTENLDGTLNSTRETKESKMCIRKNLEESRPASRRARQAKNSKEKPLLKRLMTVEEIQAEDEEVRLMNDMASSPNPNVLSARLDKFVEDRFANADTRSVRAGVLESSMKPPPESAM